MKRKRPKLSSLLFAAFMVLLLIPQTRRPIQVVINQAKLWVWSPSALDMEDQTRLAPFTYLLSDLEGTSQKMNIGKGRVTFISYWATWCPPCIAELPSIDELYSDYGNQVDFILLTQEDPEVVSNFLQKKGLDLPVFIPRMRAPEQLYSRSIPTNYLIDSTGKILIKETGAADWNSTRVRAILDGLLPNKS